MQAGIYKTCFVDFNNFNALIKIFSGLSFIMCGYCVFIANLFQDFRCFFWGGEGVDKVILASLSYKNVEVPKLSVI
jgi:hypothetical protein